MKIAKHPSLVTLGHQTYLGGMCDICKQEMYCYSSLYEGFSGRIDERDGFCKDFELKREITFKEIWTV